MRPGKDETGSLLEERRHSPLIPDGSEKKRRNRPAAKQAQAQGRDGSTEQMGEKETEGESGARRIVVQAEVGLVMYSTRWHFAKWPEWHSPSGRRDGFAGD